MSLEKDKLTIYNNDTETMILSQSSNVSMITSIYPLIISCDILGLKRNTSTIIGNELFDFLNSFDNHVQTLYDQKANTDYVFNQYISLMMGNVISGNTIPGVPVSDSTYSQIYGLDNYYVLDNNDKVYSDSNISFLPVTNMFDRKIDNALVCPLCLTRGSMRPDVVLFG